MSDAQRLFTAISTYRRLHGGQYPADAPALIVDMGTHFRDYGFPSFQAATHAFSNPDSAFSDNPAARLHPENAFPFFVLNQRPDLSPIGGPHPPGTRDVLAYTDLYYHRNIQYRGGDQATGAPVGFFIVLWDDGSVQTVPHDRVLHAPRPGGGWGIAFPGQAGLPPGTMTDTEFRHRNARRSR